jgi:hypothetical protein
MITTSGVEGLEQVVCCEVDLAALGDEGAVGVHVAELVADLVAGEADEPHAVHGGGGCVLVVDERSDAAVADDLGEDV